MAARRARRGCPQDGHVFKLKCRSAGGESADPEELEKQRNTILAREEGGGRARGGESTGEGSILGGRSFLRDEGSKYRRGEDAEGAHRC